MSSDAHATDGPDPQIFGSSTALEANPEQPYLDLLYQRLDDLRAYADERLRTVLLESGGTPQARSERESFTRLYTEDLAKYDAAEHGLCFGRIDLDGDSTDPVRYIGRLGILDDANEYEPLLLDWRAPLARPFYLATTAAPEGVRRRRHIRSRNRQVTGIHDEYLDLDAAQAAGASTDAQAQGVGSESALLSALNAARTGHMPDIVETIQHEQDTIIRAEHRGVLVVQGGPGTGKTAVALHRAAYLLYTYRQQLNKAGVLIIGPNSTFLDYISQVLPSLGETGVLLSTIGDLYPGVRATRVDSPTAGEVKGSLRILDVLKRAVRDRQTVPGTPIELSFDGHPVLLDRAIATRARSRARSSRRPHNLARPIFRTAVIEALADQLAQTLGADPFGETSLLSATDRAEIVADMRADSTITQAVDELWPLLSPQQVLSELFTQPERLRRVATKLTPAEREVLHRTDTGGFSAADAPLLDELAELLGVDDAREREQARRQWRAQLAQAQDALDILTGSAPQDIDDDLDPEILMAYDLIDADQLAQRQALRSHTTTAERAAGDRTWTYGHVIIDEAQELSEMAWRMVMRRIPNRWITVVGDIAQTSDPAGATSWGAMLEPYVANRWKPTELTVNYRTPAEIMAVAADILAVIDPTARVPRSVRATGHPPRAHQIPAAQQVTQVAHMIAEQPTAGTTAVLTPTALAATFAGLTADSVQVLTVRETKGLEFDSVYVIEPQEILRESSRGYHDLYVAATRATQRLTMVYDTELPECLSTHGG